LRFLSAVVIRLQLIGKRAELKPSQIDFAQFIPEKVADYQGFLKFMIDDEEEKQLC